MVYTGTMIEELIEAVEREERRTSAREQLNDVQEPASPLIHAAEQEVWHGAA